MSRKKAPVSWFCNGRKPADLVHASGIFRNQTLESNSGKPGRAEMRTYGLGSQILADLGVGKMRVLGHAMKAPGLSGFGLEIVRYIEGGKAPSAQDHHRHNKEKKASR